MLLAVSPDPSSSASAREDTRTRLLRVALEQLGEAGLGGLSNRSLAATAGVSLGSLTYHFPSQADLLEESFALFIDGEVERLGRLRDALGEGSLAAEQAAEAVFAAELPRRAAKLELYLQASRDPRLREIALRCLAAFDDLAAAALTAMGVADAERVGRAVVALVDGAQLRRLASGQAPDPGIAEGVLLLVRGAKHLDD